MGHWHKTVLYRLLISEMKRKKGTAAKYKGPKIEAILLLTAPECQFSWMKRCFCARLLLTTGGGVRQQMFPHLK